MTRLSPAFFPRNPQPQVTNSRETAFSTFFSAQRVHQAMCMFVTPHLVAYAPHEREEDQKTNSPSGPWWVRATPSRWTRSCRSPACPGLPAGAHTRKPSRRARPSKPTGSTRYRRRPPIGDCCCHPDSRQRRCGRRAASPTPAFPRKRCPRRTESRPGSRRSPWDRRLRSPPGSPPAFLGG